jgi:hypothetical protein
LFIPSLPFSHTREPTARSQAVLKLLGRLS